MKQIHWLLVSALMVSSASQALTRVPTSTTLVYSKTQALPLPAVAKLQPSTASKVVVKNPGYVLMDPPRPVGGP